MEQTTVLKFNYLIMYNPDCGEKDRQFAEQNTQNKSIFEKYVNFMKQGSTNTTKYHFIPI